ncbi:MAG: acyltransferase [Pedobacter sp.]|jgi:glucan biosynthesis protein C|nr:acyltransferase [Pedobacter sp.]
MAKIKTSKDLNIETLRGLAILLMVLGHVIGYSTEMGLKVKDDSDWRFSYYVLQYIRMPLFTVISGYVYAYKPLARFSSTSKFVTRKITRLLFPLVVVSTLFFIVQYITPGTNANVELGGIWRIYIFHYAHFWFLQGMMIVFLIIILLERYHILDSLKSALVCLALFAAIFLTDQPQSKFFSLNEVPFLLAFFTLGLTLKRFHDALFTKKTIVICAIIFSCAIAYQISLFGIPLSGFLNNSLTLLVGSSACILLINIGIESRKLIWLGNFSYGIYLFHVFGTAAARMILLKVHVTNNFIHVIGGMILGVGLPVILRLLVPQKSVFSLVFFGDKMAPKLIGPSTSANPVVHIPE